MTTAAKRVIILGAPRSGTNMLRDVLTQLPGVGTWPCDEINYIWRRGNAAYPSDEFGRQMATASTKRYIRRQFRLLEQKQQLNTTIEKTCANSLRVGFVDEIIPEAMYVVIVRDGVDAVASARKRWHADLDLEYVLRKARFVPREDLAYYATQYVQNHMRRLLSREKRLAYWGPQLDGMDRLLRTKTTEEICAIQWKKCVDQADQDLKNIDSHRIIRVQYEAFVHDAEAEIERIGRLLGHQVAPHLRRQLAQGISRSSVGKGRAELSSGQLARVTSIAGATLARYGYVHG